MLLQLMQKPLALPDDVNKDRFFQLVRKNRMEPMAAERLEGGLPDYDSAEETMLMMRQVTMLGQLVQLFEQCGIRVMSIKGPAMAWEMYETLSLRSYHDLDLLVSEDKIEAATALLQKVGFHWYEKESLTTKKRLAESKKIQQHYLFQKDALYLELHWRLLPWDSDDFNYLWTGRRSILMGGAQVAIPGRMDQLYHQVVHNTRHGYYRLKWLADMAQIFPSVGDELENLWRRMEQDGQQLFLLITVMLLQRLKGLEMPEMALGGIRFCRGETGVQIQAEPHKKRLIQKAEALTDELLPLLERVNGKEFSPQQQHYFRQLPYPMHKKNIISRLVAQLRPRPWVWQWIDLPDRLFFLYWPLRIAQKIGKIYKRLKSGFQ